MSFSHPLLSIPCLMVIFAFFAFLPFWFTISVSLLVGLCAWLFARSDDSVFSPR